MKCYVSNETKQMVESQIAMEAKNGGEMQLIRVYPKITKQEVFGMGGALTEASAYTYSKMSAEKRAELLDLYFGEKGNHYNFCRTHIQSCDFALGNYAYVSDKSDMELNSFNIDRDRQYILPFVKAALAKDGEIQLLASPWSPPDFMKTNGEMNHGGKLKKEYYTMWADMMVRYVDEYENEGIKIGRLTVQNEPAAVQTWDSCVYTATEEAEFAVNYLRKALDQSGHRDVKINIWDHNKELVIDRAEESFAVKGAKDAIDGIAFHWYTGDHFEALAEVRERYPEKEIIFTEGCVEYSRFASDTQLTHAELYAHDIMGDFKAGMNGFLDWNVILDEKGGPNHVGNYCDAPVMCNTEEDTIEVKLSYYYIGHFSRFIKKGAKRILTSSYHRNIETVGFVNPDGSRIMVLLNTSDKDMEFTVYDGEGSCGIVMDAHSIMTLCW